MSAELMYLCRACCADAGVDYAATAMNQAHRKHCGVCGSNGTSDLMIAGADDFARVAEGCMQRLLAARNKGEVPKPGARKDEMPYRICRSCVDKAGMCYASTGWSSGDGSQTCICCRTSSSKELYRPVDAATAQVVVDAVISKASTDLVRKLMEAPSVAIAGEARGLSIPGPDVVERLLCRILTAVAGTAAVRRVYDEAGRVCMVPGNDGSEPEPESVQLAEQPRGRDYIKVCDTCWALAGRDPVSHQDKANGVRCCSICGDKPKHGLMLVGLGLGMEIARVRARTLKAADAATKGKK